MAMDPAVKKYITGAIAAVIVLLSSLKLYVDNQPDTTPPVPVDSTQVPPPDTTTAPPPPVTGLPPVLTASLGEGVATVAEAPDPQYMPSTSYPTATRKIKVAAGANLQAVLDSAKGGDELLLAPGSTFTANYLIRNKQSTGWIVVRTDVPDSLLGAPGTRMTPTRAASLKLAKIISPNYSPAIGTENGTHHFRFTGVEIATGTAVTQMNMLIRFGESGGNGQRTIAQTPHDLGIDRSYVHGNTTGAIRRCALLNSRLTFVIDSWFDECHDPGGDSQATLGYNGSFGILIRNNTLIAGHEIVMWGGSDPADSSMSPRHIWLIGNHIFRPASWIGKWQMKTLLETKNVRWYFIYANVIENVKADAQAGFGVLFKSENQDCTAVYSQSADITIHSNILRNTGNGFNFSGVGSNSGQCKNTPAARFTVYNNWLYDMNKSPWVSQGITTQLLGNMGHVIFSHNTLDNCTPGKSLNAMSLDGSPAAIYLVFANNALCGGEYGFKGGNCAAGKPCLDMYAIPYAMKGNAVVGGGVLPAGNTQIASLAAAAGVKGSDGLQVGADTAAINRLTRNVVIAP